MARKGPVLKNTILVNARGKTDSALRACSTSPGVSARSTMMMVAAAVSVMPTPPAPAVKTKAFGFRRLCPLPASGDAPRPAWNLATAAARCFCGTSPDSSSQVPPPKAASISRWTPSAEER
eukprot:SAG22_NODE_704_length_7777_cov_6.153295_9_plen_121_part_00